MADDYSDDEDEEEDDHEQIELKEIQISFKTFEKAEVVARDEEDEMLQEAEDVLCFEKPNTRKGYFDIIKKLIILMAKDDVICSDDDTECANWQPAKSTADLLFYVTVDNMNFSIIFASTSILASGIMSCYISSWSQFLSHILSEFPESPKIA